MYYWNSTSIVYNSHFGYMAEFYGSGLQQLVEQLSATLVHSHHMQTRPLKFLPGTIQWMCNSGLRACIQEATKPWEYKQCTSTIPPPPSFPALTNVVDCSGSRDSPSVIAALTGVSEGRLVGSAATQVTQTIGASRHIQVISWHQWVALSIKPFN